MYIIAIAWIYVTLLMAATEHSITAGVLTFIFYGLLPCALFIWLIGTPQRRRNKLARQIPESVEEPFSQPDRTDTKRD
jgi:hypothetical protein